MTTVLSAMTPYKLADAYLGRISCQYLEAKSPARYDFGRKKKFPRPYKLAVWKQHGQFTGRHPLLRSSIPVLSTRQACMVTSFVPYNLVLQRQTCSVHTRGLNKSGVQFNFGTLYSVPLDLYTEITVQLTAKIR